MYNKLPLESDTWMGDACSEAKLIVVRPERTEPLRYSVLGRTYYTWTLIMVSIFHRNARCIA